jgi:uncharacterized protein (TIGR02687 family)
VLSYEQEAGIMNLETIQSDLTALFAASHQFRHDSRRVVFWYDPDQQFADVFEALEISGVQKLFYSGAWFRLKFDLHRTFAGQNILVYAPIAEPLPQDNFVYDVQITGLRFSADKANMVFLRLGLHTKSLEAYLKSRERFLGSSARVEALCALGLPPESGVVQLRMGMLCVLAGLNSFDAALWLRRVFKFGLVEHSNSVWLEAQKFFLLPELWEAIAGATGFSDSEPTLAKLFNGLTVTHLRRRWLGGFPKSLEHFLIRPDQAAFTLVHHWLDSKDNTDYKKLAAMTEKNLDIAALARVAGAGVLHDADSFAAIEMAVIRDCVDGLLERRVSDVTGWLELRTVKGWRWEDEFAEFYRVIRAATDFLSVTWQNLPPDTFALWALYQSQLFKVDRAYREFCAAFAPLELRGAEVFKSLSDFIEVVYITDYLENLGQAWSDALSEQQGRFLPVGAASQSRFFEQVVQPALLKSRVAVIISDALRFEIGTALFEELEQEDGLEVTLSARVTGLPSVTKTGMAALLPGLQLSLAPSGEVLLDGHRINSTETRDALLKMVIPKSKAMQETLLTGEKRDQIRTWMPDTDLLYVYHNIIDTTGESAALELDVPSAAATTLKELQDLVKRLIKQLNVTQIFVTADHGFLFQRRKLEEYEKLVADKTGGLEVSKRYVLGADLTAPLGAQKFDSILSGLEVVVPRGSLRFISAGRGAQYVHGGASLQETMIPVVSVRAVRGKSAGSEKVRVQLQHTGAKRITGSPFTVSLLQLEPVNAALQPRKVRLAWFDGTVPITDELRLTFDSNSLDLTGRIQMQTLSLRISQPNRLAVYTLRIRDAEDDSLLLEEDWQVDLAIPDDFGV